MESPLTPGTQLEEDADKGNIVEPPGKLGNGLQNNGYLSFQPGQGWWTGQACEARAMIVAPDWKSSGQKQLRKNLRATMGVAIMH
jgi:hypothetical protein